MNKRSLLMLLVCALVGLQVAVPVRVVAYELAPRFAACCTTAIEAAPTPVRMQLLPTVGQATAEESDKPLVRRPLLMSAVWAVGMGALAYWSRDRADRAYDAYMHSANAQRQQRHFDRAERYDRVAGAALFGMEVGVVLTSYLAFFRR